jgi:regulator of protease activity HflC (stomatin/prohibitin superfamily)
MDASTNTHLNALRLSRERPAATQDGYLMLLVLLIALAAGMYAFWRITQGEFGWSVPVLIVSGIVSLFVLCGFYLLQPNQAAAILLFGDYKGTDRTSGLRWVLPWLMRPKISTRVHNVTSERLKVNDLRGNPIEIACNVVWRVTDTAQALFDVGDYTKFLFIQIESALRHVGAKYAYDDIEHQEITLRSHADVVSAEIAAELQSGSPWRASQSTSAV